MSLKRICVRKEKLKCPKIPHCPKIPVVTLIVKLHSSFKFRPVGSNYRLGGGAHIKSNYRLGGGGGTHNFF